MGKNDTVLRGAVRGGKEKLGETGKGAFFFSSNKSAWPTHSAPQWGLPEDSQCGVNSGDENPWLVEGPLQG